MHPSLPRCFIVVSCVLALAGCLGGPEGVPCWDGSRAPTAEQCPEVTLPATTSTSSTSTSSTSSTSTSTSSTSTSTSSTSTSSTSTSTTSIPLPSCDDGIQNQNESAIDCGGPCEPCDIMCRAAEDCGVPHYSKTYCQNNDVYRDWVSYVCLNPNSNAASCRFNKTSELVDHCIDGIYECTFAQFCESIGDERECFEEARCVRPEARW